MRTVRSILAGLAIAIALVGAAAASAATWAPVAGGVAGRPMHATRDGQERVLVASVDGRRRVVVTTIASGRVVARQVVSPTTTGGVRNLRVLALPRGAALAVWGDNGGFVSAYRPAPGVRFESARIVVRIPGVGSGAARAPAVAVAPDGEVLVAWWSGPVPVGGRLTIRATTLRSGAREWAAPIDLSGGADPGLGPFGGPVAVAAAAGADGRGRRPSSAGTRSPRSIWRPRSPARAR